jgi:hypothetical protein
MKRKYIIAIIILVLVILIIGVVIIDSDYKKTDSGWQVNFRLGIGENLYKGICAVQGGNWECGGWCLKWYDHYCDFVFKDAGKECINSEQCMGGCIIEDFKRLTEQCPNWRDAKQCDGSPYCQFYCKDFKGEC